LLFQCHVVRFSSSTSGKRLTLRVSSGARRPLQPVVITDARSQTIVFKSNDFRIENCCTQSLCLRRAGASVDLARKVD
jgi:hypothetical protein